MSPWSSIETIAASNASFAGSPSGAAIIVSNVAGNAARELDRRRQLGLQRGVEVGVGRRDEVGWTRTVDAGEVGEVHHLDATGVVGDVGVGVVAEAGVLVLLVLGLVGDGHPLAGELATRQGADAAEEPLHRERRIGEELGAVRPVRRPLVGDRGEVVDQQLRGQLEVGRPPLGVGVGRVVGDRPFARAVGGQVLTPEQELDGVPTGRDVRLATLFVGLDDDVGGDLGVAGGVVDDAGRGVALDVVDVGLVHRPGVDLALGSVVGVVDRAVVEPERLGRAVVVAGGEPRVLGGRKGRVGRVGEEGLDRGLHLGRRRDRRLVAGVDQIGVRGGDGGQIVGGRSRRLRRAAVR